MEKTTVRPDEEPWDKHPKHAKPSVDVPHDGGNPGLADDGPGEAPRKSAWEHAAAGTYVDRSVPRAVAAAFLAFALAAVLLPSVGMAWFRTDGTTENRELASPPSLTGEDGSPNLAVLSGWGTYFEDHFAFRNQLVTANALVYSALGASPTDQVVVGRDGWLYYGGTLPDYLGQQQLSERALANIAHNLSLVQGYVESRGATFAFTVAPNKNTLYPEHMPYYYVQWEGQGNLERLVAHLREEGVNYVDLEALLRGEPGTWYMETDSHWDNRGALMASNSLLEALGGDALPVSRDGGELRDGFVGDLEYMLVPSGQKTQLNWCYDGYNDSADNDNQYAVRGSLWRYADGSAQDVTADWVQAEGGGRGSLLLFRDSFGNALLPFLAAGFERSAFSKLVPYNIPMMDQVGAGAVAIERAERHIPYLAENPPIAPSPTVSLGDGLPSGGEASPATTLNVRSDGPYWVLEGAAGPEVCDENTRFYVWVQPAGGAPRVYDAFWMSAPAGDSGQSDYGFRVYASAESLNLAGATVRVYAAQGGGFSLLREIPDVTPEP